MEKLPDAHTSVDAGAAEVEPHCMPAGHERHTARPPVLYVPAEQGVIELENV